MPLIGRDRELAEILALVGDPHAPLVVLTGPGRIGKSRLAAAVVAQRQRDPAQTGTAILIDLGQLPPDRTDLVLQAIADALDIPRSGAPLDADSIGAAIGERPLLLALDGMEHLVAAGPQLSTLLQSAPRLSILVTSQTVLDVYGERVYLVAPIAFPDPDTLPETPPSLEEALQYDAVRLFVQRAFGPGELPVLTPDDIMALLMVAARLEGHPLAIELAASHHRTSGDGLPDLAAALAPVREAVASPTPPARAAPD
ncbi:MAG: hypothetical protein WBA46_00005, partial [Thermomicrobiales bacterium]